LDGDEEALDGVGGSDFHQPENERHGFCLRRSSSVQASGEEIIGILEEELRARGTGRLAFLKAHRIGQRVLANPINVLGWDGEGDIPFGLEASSRVCG